MTEVLTASLKKRIVFLTLGLVITAGTSLIVQAQFGPLGDVIKKGTDPLAKLLGGTPPITTSLKDAKFGDASLEANNLPAAMPITMLERTPDGGFILQPGLYEMHAQSYCLHAGTYGPGGGDGYSYAPVEGPAKDAVLSIARNSYMHPEIPQQQIQQLLWAIVARAKFEDLTPELKAVAARLLTPKQLATLNRSALDVISGGPLQQALGKAPPGVRNILEAEARLRQMLTTPGATFAEMERIAVLAGEPPPEREAAASPRAVVKHPDGYYVRYMPQGYSYTVIQVWMPGGRMAANAGSGGAPRLGGVFATGFAPYQPSRLPDRCSGQTELPSPAIRPGSGFFKRLGNPETGKLPRPGPRIAESVNGTASCRPTRRTPARMTRPPEGGWCFSINAKSWTAAESATIRRRRRRGIKPPPPRERSEDCRRCEWNCVQQANQAFPGTGRSVHQKVAIVFRAMQEAGLQQNLQLLIAKAGAKSS
jgi:hypothetical protein